MKNKKKKNDVSRRSSFVGRKPAVIESRKWKEKYKENLLDQVED